MSCEEKKIELHLLQFHVDGIGVVSSTSFMYLFIFFFFLHYKFSLSLC